MQTVTVGLLVAKGEKTNRKCDIATDLRGTALVKPFLLQNISLYRVHRLEMTLHNSFN